MQIGGLSALPLQPWASGRYYSMPAMGGVAPSTNGTLGNGNLRVAPQYVPNTITVTRMAAGVTIAGDAGSKVRLGIYADDGTGRPGSLVLDAGTIAGDSATDQEITGLSATIGPGWYWFGGAIQLVTVTQPTVRTTTFAIGSAIDFGTSLPSVSAQGVGATMAAITGALPSTFTWGALSTVVPRIFIKT